MIHEHEENVRREAKNLRSQDKIEGINTICLVSFGPVFSRSNGYFQRVFATINALSRSYKILLMEFFQTSENNSKAGRIFEESSIKVIQIRIPSPKLINNILTLKLDKLIGWMIFFICSFRAFIKNLNELAKASVFIIEGALFVHLILLLKLLKIKLKNKRIVLDIHCANTLLYERLYRITKQLKSKILCILWKILEKSAINLSDVVIVVSETEKKYLCEKYYLDLNKVVVVPNILYNQIEDASKDLSLTEVYDLKEQSLTISKKENDIWVTFLGDLKAYHNLMCAEFILTNLASYFQKKNPSVKFLIIGKGEEILLKRIKKIPNNVIITGFIPNVLPYMIHTDIFIAPLLIGAGTKLKILSYIEYGKPVIVTPIGIEGLEYLKTLPNVIVVDINKFRETLLQKIIEISINGSRSKYRKPNICYRLLLAKVKKKLEEEFTRSLNRIVERCLRNE